MKIEEQQARLEEAFDRIEDSILPRIAMMLETLLDASAGLSQTVPRRSRPSSRPSPPSSRS